MERINKLRFSEEEMVSAKETVLKYAYEKYAGCKFPSCCKPGEYEYLLECAETDMVTEGRNLEQEAYLLCEQRLLNEIRISLFGQWRYSEYGQPQKALKQVRSLFKSYHSFVEWLRLMVPASKQDHAIVKNVYKGIVPKTKVSWAI